MASESTTHRIGKFSALQSVAEVGLGSLLHAFHVPLAGYFLSLNQAFVLTLSIKSVNCRREAISIATGVATVSAILKALSPAGKKLTPMLAITVQGLLYSLGIALLGLNLFGVVLGSILLSVWGFAQPLLIAFVIFGETLFLAIEKVWGTVSASLHLSQESGASILIAVVAAKAALAAIVGATAWRAGGRLETRYAVEMDRLRQRHVSLASPRPRVGSPIVGAARDLFRPWIGVSLCLTLTFLWVTKSESGVVIVWYGLRTLAAAWLFFWAVRSVPSAWIHWLLKKFPTLAAATSYLLAKPSKL